MIRTAFLAILSFLTLTPRSFAAPLQVVATTPDLGSIATAVGGDRVEVSSIARPSEDPHFVDARPSFVRRLNQADVLIDGGAQLESGWLPPLLEGARNPKIATDAPGRIVGSTGIALLDVPSQLDRSMGDVHPLGNPHYLLDPLNGKVVAMTIARGFCRVDPEACAGYEERAGKFEALIDAKMSEWAALLAPASGSKVVAYHKNFDYLARRFGLEVIGYLEPKPGIPPSPSHLADLIPRMQAAHVRAILAEPNRERQNPEFVAEKTGATVLWLPIMPGEDKTTDYPSLIDYDVRQLAAVLANR